MLVTSKGWGVIFAPFKYLKVMPAKKYFTEEECKMGARLIAKNYYLKMKFGSKKQRKKLHDRLLKNRKISLANQKSRYLEDEDYRKNKILYSVEYQKKKKDDLDYRLKHVKYHRDWVARNVEKAKEYYKKKSKESKDNLSDNYIVNGLLGLKIAEISDELLLINLIELKKISIISKRLIKQSKQNEQEKVV